MFGLWEESEESEEIAELAADDEAYASKHAWRDRPETWSEGFKRLQEQTWRDGVTLLRSVTRLWGAQRSAHDEAMRDLQGCC